MACRVHREWFPPTGYENANTPLKLYNSLLDEKVPFVPVGGPNSKNIGWYTCGPTVYDSAHVGHARNFLTFDIVRRVLEDYFGYNILYVMNVTDVDDKIVLRARRNYLLGQYKSKNPSAEEVKSYASQALTSSAAKQRAKVAELQAQAEAAAAEASASSEERAASAARRREELEGALRGEQHKLGQTEVALATLGALQLPGDAKAGVDAVLAIASDYVAEALDKELGAQVTDHSIFRAHAEKYEREFLEDMTALGCRPPDVLTRVSEYMKEIIEYVTRILDQGMAYEANGSVYFDTSKFRECGHTYGKLKPWAVGSASLASEGESNFETSEKRNPADFALWKASKPGEPFWESPWGKGRPGWHIECSAMASKIIGAKLDIHTGGEDLRFPHHDNELAQAEAFFHDQGCKQWVNYFLHSGHLGIEGLKMSKSLKNFVTIREALKTFTPRQLRLMFCLQPWNKPMSYGESSRLEMKAKETLLRNFFQNVDVAMRGADICGTSARWEAEEHDLNQRVMEAQARVHDALCDNLNTSAAIEAICDIIRHTNVYLSKRQGGAGARSSSGGAAPTAGVVQPLLLRKAAAFVTRILSVFGLVDGPGDRLGFSTDVGSSGSGASAGGPDHATSAKQLDALAAFRDSVRQLAKSKEGGRAALLAACDEARDTTLAGLGATAEARGSGGPQWRLASPSNYLVAFTEFLDDVRALAESGAEAGKIMAACDKVRDVTLVDLGVRLEDRPDGRAVWKLDDPEVMRQEAAERAALQAEAARKKIVTKLDLKSKELDKFQKLIALPPIEQQLADKFSKWEGGEPTHDKEGVALEGKAKDKARKEVDKARKAREPLEKKLAEDPKFLDSLAAEVAELSQQLKALDVAAGSGGANGKKA